METIAAVLIASLAAGAAAHEDDRSPGRPPGVEQGPRREARRPPPPKLATLRGLRPATLEELRLIYARPRPTFSTACAVAFDDPTALALIPNGAVDGTAGAPWWFQNCFGTLGNYAVVRPIVYSHFHLFFEDDSIVCLDLETGAFGRTQPDGSCSSAGIDHGQEPRYVQPHLGDEQIHLFVVNQSVIPEDPYSDSTSDKKPFDLRRIRVVSEVPVRVCYKKVQEIEGPWIAAPDVPIHGEPGVWLCWSSLGQGLWDLSTWAFDVREVKVLSSDGVSVPAIDDFEVAVQ